MDTKKLRKTRINILITFVPAYIVGYFSYRNFTTLKKPYQGKYTKYYLDTAKELWETGRCDKGKYFNIETYRPKLKKQ